MILNAETRRSKSSLNNILAWKERHELFSVRWTRLQPEENSQVDVNIAKVGKCCMCEIQWEAMKYNTMKYKKR